jgi:hypothetical protein
MYRYDHQISLFSDPALFIMGKGLNPENRWVKIAHMIPWDVMEKKYAACFKVKGNGRPAKPARQALASHLVKEKYSLSDEETVDMIRENPYLQYLLGKQNYEDKRPFDPSTMIWFRKRMTSEMIMELNEYIIAGSKTNDNDDDDTDGGVGAGLGDGGGESTENQGTLIMDATCTPADIKFPTDVNLLNEAREKLEKLIDRIHEGTCDSEKPRTYRRQARKEYLRFTRKRKPSRRDIKTAIRKQLAYVKRDLGYIAGMDTTVLTNKELARLSVIEELHRQQSEMYSTGTHQVKDRIVSISQPHVRPIVRGKANAHVEFGAKVAISMEGGFARVEKISWDAFNESLTFIGAVERYRVRSGHYPSRVLVDKIYRTRENIAYCKTNGIAISGPRLGRPPADKAVYREQCLAERLEAGERNAVEGEFGTAKTKYSLDRIMMRLKETSEIQIHLTFLSMNIWRQVRLSSVLFFEILKIADFSGFGIDRYVFGSQWRNLALA